ncbi:hypothetical protein NQ314_007226 [Rhamnusium bicolor]|uniref:Uncharacterized protein n=1 Tax=Rhamnusium bicolor TaxID=1586634 RepID=A0AAV8YPI4_9CUCU|nr:hypothetical protein NQ314_007226 [Rhamnusium bicolor]
MFFKSIELTAKSVVENIASKQGEHVKVANGTKRKNSSSVKHDKPKKSKLDKKPTTKIIIQPKPPSQANPTVPANASLSVDQKRNCGLQSLIDSCKINIPSSLSITLKENNENRVPVLVPPVKNYIEILKLPDENSMGIDIDNKTETSKIDKSVSTLCDNDSEQKVDQDLSEIAKSLTEKIPMSTTVSQIVGPKPQFPIPVKSNVPVKFHIQPSPVPEVPCKVLNMPKDNKLSPRSPQTFQKIFEESIKKPDGTSQSPEKDPQKTALDLSNEPSIASNAKRNILEIASQLYKKTRLEHEKYQTEVKSDETSTPGPAPKVPIPRLPNQRTLKPPQKNSKFEVMDSLKFPQTLTNLHSNTLGLNYTISVGQSVTPKVNGIVSPARMDSETKPLAEAPSKSPGVTASSPNPFVPPIDLPSSSPRPNSVSRNMSPILGYNSPRNSPRHSPKSSPMVKHMYAPLPNIMDQLRVHTFNQKMPPSMLNTLSKLSPKLQTSSPKIHSPSKPPSSSPKLLSSSPKLPGSPTKVATSTSPKLANALPKPSLPQPSSSISVKPLQVGVSPKNASASPTSASSSKSAQKASPGGSQSSPLSPNQILEKYNIQNLAQLTASLNFNSGNFGLNPSNQLAALQHAMLLKHFEMQNRQNWLNMNQGPLLQYEKYLQSLKSNQNHLLGNIKEN